MAFLSIVIVNQFSLTFFAADHEYGVNLDNDALNMCIYAILYLEVRNGFYFLQEQYLIVIQRDVSCIKIQDQVQGQDLCKVC